MNGKIKKWLKKVTKWDERTPHEKKGYLARVIGSTVFFVIGIIVGIVALYLNGWDFVKFITDPTVDLIMLFCLVGGIFLLTYKGNRKELD